MGRLARHSATARPPPVAKEALTRALLRMSRMGPGDAWSAVVEKGEPLLVPAM
jgi:hypothetical protein